MTDLKTMTLSNERDEDSPSFVICFGHVDVVTFNQAHTNEGWTHDEDYQAKDLKHDYGLQVGSKWSWGHDKSTPNVQAITVAAWG